MILISHRGNIKEINRDRENSPKYIEEALNFGYDVEIDVWYRKNYFFLVHDLPLYKIDSNFLLNNKIWCHAKNSEALYNLKKINAHFFWHNIDDYTITSKGYVWVYPGKKVLKGSICVLPKKNV